VKRENAIKVQGSPCAFGNDPGWTVAGFDETGQRDVDGHERHGPGGAGLELYFCFLAKNGSVFPPVA